VANKEIRKKKKEWQSCPETQEFILATIPFLLN